MHNSVLEAKKILEKYGKKIQENIGKQSKTIQYR